MPRNAKREKGLLDLVAQFYDSATERAGWAEAVEATRRYFHAGTGQLYRRRKGAWRTELYIGAQVPPASMGDYHAHFGKLDPNYWAKLKLPAGVATASNLLMSDRAWENTEYVADWLRPTFADNVYYQAGVLFENDHGVEACISVQRPRAAGGFTRDDLADLEVLAPHLRRILSIERKLSRWAADRQVLAEVLERLPHAMVLLDEKGGVAYFNRAADALLRERTALTVCAGRLHSQSPSESAALQRLIIAALGTSNGQSLAPGGELLVHDRQGRPALMAAVMPIRLSPERHGTASRPVRAVVFLSKSHAPRRLSLELLQRRFSLTPAEARVALSIAEGLGVKEIAERAATSVGTVRNQLKSVFGKMDVRRQAELVRVLLAGPPERAAGSEARD